MMLRKLTSAMILMGAAGMANAYVETVPIVIDHPLAQTDWNVTDPVAQFNPANYGGARLNSVHIIDIEGSLHSDGGTVTCFIPDGQGNCTGHVDADVNITITGPAGSGISIPVSLAFPQFNYSLTGQNSSVAIPGGDLLGPGAGVWFCIVADMPGCVINPAVVALFEGAGTVNFTVNADGTVGTQNDTGTAGANYPLSADARYSIVYDYEPPVQQAPEPASIALMGLGLAGLGVWRRRKA